MSSKIDQPELTSRAAYKFWAEDNVRFADLDALGHVNNNTFGIYFETGRVAFMTGIGIRNGPEDPAVVIVHFEIDFRAELHFPARLDIGIAVAAIGTSSVTLAGGLFHDDLCHATSKAVMVRLNRETRRSIALSAEERETLGKYALPNLSSLNGGSRACTLSIGNYPNRVARIVRKTTE